MSSEADETVFVKKTKNVDVQLVQQLRNDKDLIAKLLEADSNQNADLRDKLMDEAEGFFDSVSSWKISEEEQKLGIDDALYLFQLAQVIMEIKSVKLQEEEDGHADTKKKLKKTKDELKKAKDENRIQLEKIAEMDEEMSSYTQELEAAYTTNAASRTRGDTPLQSSTLRSDTEVKILERQLESTKEELNTAKRNLANEVGKTKDLDSELSKARRDLDDLKSQIRELETQVEDLTVEKQDLQRKGAKANELKQKSTKNVLKYIKEIQAITEKNGELEDALKTTKDELELITMDRASVSEQLETTRTALDKVTKTKEDLESENRQLRDKVAELTVREDQREEDHEALMQQISQKVKSLKEESAHRAGELAAREAELQKALSTIRKMEAEKKHNEAERRREEMQNQIEQLQSEKSELLDKYVQLQKENKTIRTQLNKAAEEEKKVEKRMQMHYRARENEVRTAFFARQEEMNEAERRKSDLENQLADAQNQILELESHISKLESGTFGLSDAMSKIRELKRELETSHGKISSRMKDLNESWRKIEDLYEEVRLLRDQLKRIDPSLKNVDFLPVNELDQGSELEWTDHKPGFRLDISAYKVKTAMELEKAKAATLQLEREVEALETERLEMKSQLRHLSLQRGERAARLGMSAADIEKLDAFAEQLKSGIDGPLMDSGPSAGEKNRVRKLEQRLEEKERELKETQKALSDALEKNEALEDDLRSKNTIRGAIQDLQALKDGLSQAYSQQFAYMEQLSQSGPYVQEQALPEEAAAATDAMDVSEGNQPSRAAGKPPAAPQAAPSAASQAAPSAASQAASSAAPQAAPSAAPQAASSGLQPAGDGQSSSSTAAGSQSGGGRGTRTPSGGSSTGKPEASKGQPLLQGTPSRAAMSYVPPPMLFGSNNIVEQLSKALREGELGNEASLQVHVRSCKNLPRQRCYLSLSTKQSRDTRKSQTQSNTNNPSFDESFSFVVQNRNTDVMVVNVFEVGPQNLQDDSQLLGKVELRVSDFGKLDKEVWGGSTSGWFDLLDSNGNAVYASPGDSRKSQIDLTVEFVEAPKKKVAQLEKQLENLQNLYDIAKERIESRESEIRRLNEDLTRKTEDLVEVRSERDDARDQLKKIRMNAGIASTQVAFQPARSVSTPQETSKEATLGATSLQTAEVVSQESYEVVQKLNQEIGNLNAYLIQTLDDLGNKEDELAKSKEEMKRNREDLDVIKTQQLLIYKEYAQKVGGLESEIEALRKKLATERDKSEQESKKAFSALRKFQDLSENLHPDDVKRKLIESERNLILIQADQDTADRVAKLKSEEARQLRNRYDELVIEMSRQEQRLKHRIGVLERTKRADERRLNEFQRRFTETVSKEEWNKLKYDHIILQEKHKAILSRESKALLERASVEAFRKRAERTEQDMSEMKVKLQEASEKASSLESRLEQLATGDSNQNQQQLAALSQKVIKLEVSERNAVRRAELALERMQSMEKDNLRIQERIAALEDESIEHVSRIHELEETENELRQRMEGSISAEQAKEWKTKMQAQEGEISELNIKVSQLQEIADLATDQAKAMEELHMAHAEELDALRQCLSRLHSESDESAETGALQRQVMDRERQIHEMKSKLSNLDKELARMDDYAIRLEEMLEKKSSQVFSISDESHNTIRALERQVEEQRARLAGSISLDQADEWAQSLRDLTDQKQKALEDLTDAKKKIEDAEHKAASLKVQLDDQKAFAKQLMEQLREAGGASGSSNMQPVLQRLSQQTDELTSYKLESLRLSRQVRQMQERENHLEHLCQQNEKEVRKLEEQVIILQAEKDGAEAKRATEMEALKSKIKELELAAREDMMPGKGSMMSHAMEGRATLRRVPSSHSSKSKVEVPPELSAAEARAMDHEAIIAMRNELIALTEKLKDKEDEIERLNKDLEDVSYRGESEVKSKFDMGDSQAGLTEAAQHTQEVARLTIERLEKNNKRKNEMITKYQEQLRQAREEYMSQKELDNATIEELREKLAAKTQEALSNLRSRTAGHGNINILHSTASADADAIFAEKDQVISALNGELQSLNRRNEELSRTKERLEENLKMKEEEIKIKDEEIKKSEGRKPSQVLETLVLKLKNQLAEKDKKQQEMKSAIASLKQEMLDAAEVKAKAEVEGMRGPAGDGTDAALVAQSAKLKEQVDALESKLTSLRSRFSDVKKQLEEEQTKSSNLVKEKESLESTIRRQATDLKKAQRLQREAQEAVKRLENSTQQDTSKILELEKKIREATSSRAERPSTVPEPARGGAEGERENAMRKWESEKRLEAKVEKLQNSLQNARKQNETLEKQHAVDKERMEKEAERLRQRAEILEEDKKQLRAQLRGAGQPADSDEVLARVREAERKVMEVEERNDQLLKELNVEGKIKVEQQRQTVNMLEKQIKELQETNQSQAQQLRAIDDENSYMREKSREMKRLETSIAELRTRNENLENELLGAQNELVRLRFETEHSDLRLERWKRRVRELEALPLAVGKAEGLDSKPGKKKTKEEEEMERFVRSTKIAMEKLHRENESLKANSATNVKYMDSVREAKSLKLALAERDKEISSLNERLLNMKDQVEKKAKLDEKVRSLERQLKAEQETSKDLQDRLTEKSRRVNRLESDLASARESAGGDGALSDRVREAIEEAEALRSKLRAAEREKVALEKERDESRRDLRLAEKRAEECMQRLEEEMRRLPKTAGQMSSHGDLEEMKKLRDKIRDLETENEDLKGELNCFDPAFFDEIEDLKYNHNEMTKLVDRYEALLMQLSSRYGFEFTPQTTAKRGSRA